MSTSDTITKILTVTLQLGDRGNDLHEKSPLLGALPEFDSMAVVNVIAAIEENFGIEMDDDEITAEIFESVGTLSGFVDEKMQ